MNSLEVKVFVVVAILVLFVTVNLQNRFLLVPFVWIIAFLHPFEVIETSVDRFFDLFLDHVEEVVQRKEEWVRSNTPSCVSSAINVFEVN